MTDSYIKTGPGGTLFAGPDATRLFQAMTLRAALRLLARGIQPRRDFTMRRALDAVSAITGKSYPSTGRARRTAVGDAQADLERWIVTMQAALPVVSDECGSGR